MSTPPATYEEAQERIELRHLAQLSNLELQRRPDTPDGTTNHWPIPPVLLGWLTDWSKAQATTIQNAIENRVYGGSDGSPINWQYTFFAFMEAVTTYLRDWGKVIEAVDAFKEGNLKKALKKLRESLSDINTIAALWNVNVVTLCDLSREKGVTHPWNGPFALAFYSKEGSPAFTSVAFKGTNPFLLGDLFVDLHYGAIQQPAGTLWGTHVSKGVTNGLFGDFGTGEQSQQGFTLIQQGLSDIASVLKPSEPVMTHVTGHSLGGNYANVCYTQFTEPQALPANLSLGDLYTFGSPRSGEQDFAVALKDHLGQGTGSSWRIVNEGDAVPTVPPVTGFSGNQVFIHLDNGYEISKSAAPVQIPTEIGTEPAAKLPLNWGPHFPQNYYKALVEALSKQS